MKRACASVLAIVACSACGGADEPLAGSSPDAGVSYYKDVKPILDAKCSGCHVDGGIAPFALTSYDEVHAVNGPIKEAVSSRTMPPWLAGQGCNEYVDDRSLTDDEIAQIGAWVDRGAPAGDAADEPPPAAGSFRTLSRVDRTLAMPEVYTPQEEPDDYRCFLLDWQESQPTYVTGFRANPGNPATVHHVIAFLIAPERAQQFEQFDAAEAGPGYTCYGGPGAGADNTGWIGAWAPGGQGSDLPAGTGILVMPGSKIALQVHYNTANGSGADQTSIDLKLDPTVETHGSWQFWAGLDWVFGNGMQIPAGEADVSHAFSADPTALLNGGKSFTIHSAALHMHTRGTSARLAIERSGAGRGQSECLLDIPRWDFHWQLHYDLTKPTALQAGDKLAISCHWDNSMGNQPTMNGTPVPPKDLSWGEGTGDEMCLGAVYISAP